MIYFTSDLHLFHPFVAATRGYGPRVDNLNYYVRRVGESQLERETRTYAHDLKVIGRINSRVGKTDELYVLGDVSKGTGNSFERSLELLHSNLNVPRSRLHLVLGNHENFKLKDSSTSRSSITVFDVFGYVSRSEYLFVDWYPVVLTHLPLVEDMEGPSRDGESENSRSKSLRKYAVSVPEGVVHLHGHTHSSTPFDSRKKLSLNVGLDAWKGMPVSWLDVKRKLELE